MDRSATAILRIGDWTVHPVSGELSRGNETLRLEERTLRLLLCLAEHAGEVVSIDELLSHVWQGVIVTPDSVYQAVTSLRRLLGDDTKRPTYIATVPRRGYRLVAVVTRVTDDIAAAVAVVASPEVTPSPRRGTAARLAIPALLVLLLVGAFAVFFISRHPSAAPIATAASAPHQAKSIAVLPLLDLTDQMNEEPFADGMTEELIDQLSKAPGLKVSPPTSSFYFKGKQVTVAEVAKSLGVAYVLDGSVRKSGTTLRVAARLIRADDGFVVWSETYDRTWDDRLMIQDDIASEVTKALTTSIR
jgi:TolB-like protein/DNA-binding winged helix-turn-helix (wHTH) protein